LEQNKLAPHGQRTSTFENKKRELVYFKGNCAV
jgi:hypothetical protein